MVPERPHRGTRSVRAAASLAQRRALLTALLRGVTRGDLLEIAQQAKQANTHPLHSRHSRATSCSAKETRNAASSAPSACPTIYEKPALRWRLSESEALRVASDEERRRPLRVVGKVQVERLGADLRPLLRRYAGRTRTLRHTH